MVMLPKELQLLGHHHGKGNCLATLKQSSSMQPCCHGCRCQVEMIRTSTFGQAQLPESRLSR